MRVWEYGPDVLFVHKGTVFFGLKKYFVGGSSEEIEAGFRLSVCVIFV